MGLRCFSFSSSSLVFTPQEGIGSLSAADLLGLERSRTFNVSLISLVDQMLSHLPSVISWLNSKNLEVGKTSSLQHSFGSKAFFRD